MTTALRYRRRHLKSQIVTSSVMEAAVGMLRRILLIRGRRVLLDSDLARLYGVSVGRLNEAVKRNSRRFPADFMFQLSPDEAAALLRADRLKSQFAISSSRWGGRRQRPYAFTQEGVAMLSGVLRSGRAIEVNVAIMRAFVRLRRLLAENHELADKLEEVERKVAEHDGQIGALFDAIRGLMSGPEESRRQIGFTPEGK